MPDGLKTDRCDLTGTGEIEVFIGSASAAEIAMSGDIANRGAYHGYLADKWGLV